MEDIVKRPEESMIQYYERTGGRVYSQGNWPKEWLDEAGKQIKEAIEEGINEDIKRDKKAGEKNIYINCYELKRDEVAEHSNNYITQFAEKYMSALFDPSFTSLDTQKTYHGLGRGAGPIEPTDAYYVQLAPKVKWFKPPLTIKIFKWEINMAWAYKVHKSYLLKNLQPVPPNYKPSKEEQKNDRISDSGAKRIMRELASEDDEEDHNITLEWQAMPYHNPEIDKMAEELKKNYENNIIKKEEVE